MRRHFGGEAVQIVNQSSDRGVDVVCIMFSDGMTQWVPASSVTR